MLKKGNGKDSPIKEPKEPKNSPSKEPKKAHSSNGADVEAAPKETSSIMTEV